VLVSLINHIFLELENHSEEFASLGLHQMNMIRLQLTDHSNLVREYNPRDEDYTMVVTRPPHFAFIDYDTASQLYDSSEVQLPVDHHQPLPGELIWSDLNASLEYVMKEPIAHPTVRYRVAHEMALDGPDCQKKTDRRDSFLEGLPEESERFSYKSGKHVCGFTEYEPSNKRPKLNVGPLSILPKKRTAVQAADMLSRDILTEHAITALLVGVYYIAFFEPAINILHPIRQQGHISVVKQERHHRDYR